MLQYTYIIISITYYFNNNLATLSTLVLSFGLMEYRISVYGI